MRIGAREVQLTNLDKVYFPDRNLTKGDLVRYYLEVGDCVLPHIRRRPMQMLRYPDGVDGFFFYQKRVPDPHPDWLETVHIVFPGSGRTADFPVVTDAASLAWIANLGCIDLHTWHCRVDDIECPDRRLRRVVMLSRRAHRGKGPDVGGLLRNPDVVAKTCLHGGATSFSLEENLAHGTSSLPTDCCSSCINPSGEISWIDPYRACRSCCAAS